MVQAYGIGGVFNVLPSALTSNGPPIANTFNTLGQECFDKSTTPPTLYIFNGQTWVSPSVSGSAGTFTSVTATAGNITASNGNIVLGTAGNKLVSTSVGTTAAAGANSIGSATLVAGTVTIATTAVTASSLIIVWRQSIGATGAAALGMLTVGTITSGTSFVINAALTATATSLATTDVSVVGYMIIN